LFCGELMHEASQSTFNNSWRVHAREFFKRFEDNGGYCASDGCFFRCNACASCSGNWEVLVGLVQQRHPWFKLKGRGVW
jgi:hypothetical protein